MNRSSLLSVWLLLGLVPFPSSVAAGQVADVPPVVVVIEAGDARVDAARIRTAMQAELGIPVVSVLEAMHRETLGTLSVALVEHGRRAAIEYVPSDGTAFAVLVEVRATSPTDANGEWLIAPCVSAVRTSNQRRAAVGTPAEVLDPWLASRVIPESAGGEPREVLDPWVGTPRRRVRVAVQDYYLGDDIIDPWAEAVTRYRDEQARRLSRPRARTSTSAPRSPAPAPSMRPTPTR